MAKKKAVRTKKKTPKWVIIVGNVVDGVGLIGPFDDATDANTYADECRPCRHDTWVVSPVALPED